MDQQYTDSMKQMGRWAQIQNHIRIQQYQLEIFSFQSGTQNALNVTNKKKIAPKLEYSSDWGIQINKIMEH